MCWFDSSLWPSFTLISLIPVNVMVFYNSVGILLSCLSMNINIVLVILELDLCNLLIYICLHFVLIFYYLHCVEAENPCGEKQLQSRMER